MAKKSKKSEVAAIEQSEEQTSSLQTDKEIQPVEQSSLPLFYRKPVALNSAAHKELMVGESSTKYGFASKTNSVLVAGIEFIEACKEFPVVFAAAANGKTVPVALLGLRNDENLFIKEDGSWDGRYVPAYIRRYPFILADSGDDKMTVCIDEEFDGLNGEAGSHLFDADGNQTEYAKQIIAFLQDFQIQSKRTELLAEKIDALGLFKDMDAVVSMNDGRRLVLNGFKVVDEAKLLSLKKDDAFDLFKSGYLSLIYAHLLSLSTMAALVDRLAARKD